MPSNVRNTEYIVLNSYVFIRKYVRTNRKSMHIIDNVLSQCFMNESLPVALGFSCHLLRALIYFFNGNNDKSFFGGDVNTVDG